MPKNLTCKCGCKCFIDHATHRKKSGGCRLKDYYECRKCGRLIRRDSL